MYSKKRKNDLSFHIQKIENKLKLILKLVRETRTIRIEINETVNRKTIENETKTCFFVMFDKIGNVIRLIKVYGS